VSVFRGTVDVLPFLRRFLDLRERQVYQGTRLRPEFPVIPFPVDLESLRQLPCGDRIAHELRLIRETGEPPVEGSLRDYLESSVGPTLTELAFEGFNHKFWGRRLEDMPAEWGKLRRLERIAETGDFRLPSTAPHYYPAGGFNSLFEQMLAGFDVRTRTRVSGIEPDGKGATLVVTDGGVLPADVVIATAPIDGLLGYRFGSLEWRGYRIEAEVVANPEQRELGRAPDGVSFAWVYTPWPETPVCRTTDFGAIHQGPRPSEPAVLLREIADDAVPMYPVWWEEDRLFRYLEAATRIQGLIPLGRLGLYKYVTVDSTFAMVERMLESLERYLAAEPASRLEILREIRGDWRN
jgi:UDP-galactopyranose mutase